MKLALCFLVTILYLSSCDKSSNSYNLNDSSNNYNLNDGIIAKFTFDGSSKDLSSNGNHAENNGGVLTTNRFGEKDKAYFFDGYSYMSIPQSPITNKLTDSFSISVWAKGSAAYTNDTRFSIAGIIGPSNLAPFGIGIDDGDRAVFQIFDEGFKIEALKVSENFSTNSWNHYVGVFNSSKSIMLYLNGKKVIEITENIPSKINPPTSDIWIGTRSLSFNSNTPRYFFNGSIDDIRIYDRAISETEAEVLFKLSE